MKGLMHQLFGYNIEFYAVEHTKGKTDGGKQQQLQQQNNNRHLSS